LRKVFVTQESDGMNDGMPTMTHRTTFALDEATARRLKRLAARWRVSQAEVVRRSLEQAEKRTEVQKPDPIALLRRLHENGGGLDRKKAEAYLAEVYEDRKHWRKE
jgi:predicted transcriptional regulator